MMKYKSLLLCALPVVTVGTLTSCNKDEPKAISAEELVIPQAPDIPVATPAQRAELLGELALVPADSSAVLSVCNIDKNIPALQNSRVGQFLEHIREEAYEVVVPNPEEVEPEANEEAEEAGAVNADELMQEEKQIAEEGNKVDQIPVKSVTIALGKGGEKTLAALNRLNKISSDIQAKAMVAGVKADGGDIMSTYLGTVSDNLNLTLDDQSAPITIYATLDDETAAQVKDTINQGIFLGAMAGQGALKPIEVKSGDVAFKGFHVDGTKLMPLLQTTLGALKDEDQAKLEKLVNSISFDLVAGFKGNTVILSISGNANKFAVLPASPDQSFLAKPELRLVDGHLKDNAISYAYCAPEVTSVNMEGLEAELIRNLDLSQKLLDRHVANGKVDAQQVASSKQATEALKQTAHQYFQGVDRTQPSVLFAWSDAQGVAWEYQRPNNANDFDWKKPISTMTGLLSTPSALVSLSSLTPEAKAMSRASLEALATIANNWLSILPPPPPMDGKDAPADAPAPKKCLDQLEKLKPMISSLWKTAVELDSSVGPQLGTVLDFKNFASSEGAANIQPRVAISQPVINKSQVEKAMKEFGKTLAEHAQDAPCLKDVNWTSPAVVEEKDGSKWFSYAPASAPDNPVLTAGLTKYYWTVGSDPVLTRAVSEATMLPNMDAIQPTAYGPTGLALKLNLAQVAPWVRSMSDKDSHPEGDRRPPVDPALVASFVAALAEDIQSVNYTVSQEQGKTVERLRIESTAK